MSEHYYHSKDLANFSKVADFQKNLEKNFFVIMEKFSKTVN